MEKYLITGGAGFIGSNITRKLVRQRKKVVVIDNLSTGKKVNLKDLENKIEFIRGDIRNLKLLEKTCKNIDYVIHQAAIPSVPRSIANPLESARANEIGTLNVLLAARDNKVRRVIYASSSSAYGDQKELRKSEKLKALPKSPYAISKYTGELYCQNFWEIYDLETICLRYFNVFGPYQDPTSQYSAVIPKFITAVLKNKKPIIYGDGQQARDFTYVENNVDANILACQAPKNAVGKVYNIACGKSINLNTLLKLINQALNKNVKPIYQAKRAGDVMYSLADITLARKFLGYQPKINFIEGLRLTINWYKKYVE